MFVAMRNIFLEDVARYKSVGLTSQVSTLESDLP